MDRKAEEADLEALLLQQVLSDQAGSGRVAAAAGHIDGPLLRAGMLQQKTHCRLEIFARLVVVAGCLQLPITWPRTVHVSFTRKVASSPMPYLLAQETMSRQLPMTLPRKANLHQLHAKMPGPAQLERACQA